MTRETSPISPEHFEARLGGGYETEDAKATQQLNDCWMRLLYVLQDTLSKSARDIAGSLMLICNDVERIDLRRASQGVKADVLGEIAILQKDAGLMKNPDVKSYCDRIEKLVKESGNGSM